MIENLGRAIDQATERQFINQEQGKFILDTARLELRECPVCLNPPFWRDLLDYPGADPGLTRDLLLNHVAERRAYFVRIGWLPADAQVNIRIK